MFTNMTSLVRLWLLWMCNFCIGRIYHSSHLLQWRSKWMFFFWTPCSCCWWSSVQHISQPFLQFTTYVL